MRLLRPRTHQIRLHRLEPAGAQLGHGLYYRARHIARFFLNKLIPIQRVVTGRIRLVVADVAVQSSQSDRARRESSIPASSPWTISP